MKAQRLFKYVAVLVTLAAILSACGAPAAPATPQVMENTVEVQVTTVVEQEVIVRYKSGLSPEELVEKVNARKKKGEPFIIGPIRIWIENMKLALSKNEIPEVHLSTIESIEDSISASQQEILLKDEGVSNIYLVKYSSAENIERVVKMFQSIPEVEFAEPNYIYEELGI